MPRLREDVPAGGLPAGGLPAGGFPATFVDHPTLIAPASMRRMGEVADDPTDAAAGATPTFTHPATDSDLDLLDVLGTGGLNVVHRAHHRPLGRQVAVKRVRPDRDTALVRQVLLREARITGALEHPGVVPIHDLRFTDAGEPLVLLKRISGSTWAELIHDPAAWQARAGGSEDWLSWHLRVLVRVCEVVHFAHTRGYVHRDLKPENVMIGEHGEVLVVDWGLAVALDDRADPDVPRAADVKQAAGTPAYMAPEMLGDGAPIGPRTDVFLLGAILYELVAGVPPHWGEVDAALLARIRACDVTPPASGSEWLLAIQARAMQPDPEDRYASADALRAVVQHFLEHRGADQLARRAREQLSTLLYRAAQPEADRQQAYLLYGQIRLGFGQVLAAWAHHDGAQEGLAAATRAMVELELRREDPEAAALLLAELDPAPPELEARLHEVRSRVERARVEAEKQRAVGAVYDLKRGARTRTFVLLIMGTMFTLIPWVPYAWADERGWMTTYPTLIGSSVVFLAIAAGLAVWARESLSATAVNRGMAGGLALIFVGQIAMDLGAWRFGLEPMVAHTMHMILWAAVSAVLAIVVARPVAVGAVIFLVGYAVAVLHPAWAWPMVSITNFSFTVLVVWMGRRLLGRELLPPGGVLGRRAAAPSGAGPP